MHGMVWFWLFAAVFLVLINVFGIWFSDRVGLGRQSRHAARRNALDTIEKIEGE